MTIKVGDRLPEAALNELTVEYTQGCPTGPESFKVSGLTRGKRIVIFGLPGAFTRTCPEKPGQFGVSSAEKMLEQFQGRSTTGT